MTGIVNGSAFEALEGPLGIFPEFIGSSTTTLDMHEHFTWGEVSHLTHDFRIQYMSTGRLREQDQFPINDVNGVKVLSCKKAPSGLHHSMSELNDVVPSRYLFSAQCPPVVSDGQGRPLYTLSDTLLSVEKTFVARNARDETKEALFAVTRHLFGELLDGEVGPSSSV